MITDPTFNRKSETQPSVDSGVNILSLAKRALRDELSLMTKEDQLEVVQFLVEERLTIRTYFLEPEFVRQVLWPRIRENELILHTLMNSLVTFRQLLAIEAKENIDRVTDLVTQSLVGTAGLEVDEDFHSHLAQERNIKGLLKSNLWLTWYLLLVQHLSYLGLTHLLVQRGGK